MLLETRLVVSEFDGLFWRILYCWTFLLRAAFMSQACGVYFRLGVGIPIEISRLHAIKFSILRCSCYCIFDPLLLG